MESRLSIGSAQEKIHRSFETGLRTGDTFTLTSGREVYPMGNGGMMEVGPIQATITVAEGERPQDAYGRARTLVEVLFQAEFEMKKLQYNARIQELHA